MTPLNLFNHSSVWVSKGDKGCKTINFPEFCSINFEHDFPIILNDIFKHLLNFDIISEINKQENDFNPNSSILSDEMEDAMSISEYVQFLSDQGYWKGSDAKFFKE